MISSPRGGGELLANHISTLLGRLAGLGSQIGTHISNQSAIGSKQADRLLLDLWGLKIGWSYISEQASSKRFRPLFLETSERLSHGVRVLIFQNRHTAYHNRS